MVNETPATTDETPEYKRHAVERRAYISGLLKDGGMVFFPTLQSIADKFHVSKTLIHKDLKKVIEEIGADKPELTILEYRKVCQSAIKKLNELSTLAKTPEAQARIITEIRKTVRSEAELRQKFGLIKGVDANKDHSINISFTAASPRKEKDASLP